MLASANVTLGVEVQPLNSVPADASGATIVTSVPTAAEVTSASFTYALPPFFIAILWMSPGFSVYISSNIYGSSFVPVPLFTLKPVGTTEEVLSLGIVIQNSSGVSTTSYSSTFISPKYH